MVRTYDLVVVEKDAESALKRGSGPANTSRVFVYLICDPRAPTARRNSSVKRVPRVAPNMLYFCSLRSASEGVWCDPVRGLLGKTKSTNAAAMLLSGIPCNDFICADV